MDPQGLNLDNEEIKNNNSLLRYSLLGFCSINVVLYLISLTFEQITEGFRSSNIELAYLFINTYFVIYSICFLSYSVISFKYAISKKIAARKITAVIFFIFSIIGIGIFLYCNSLDKSSVEKLIPLTFFYIVEAVLFSVFSIGLSISCLKLRLKESIITLVINIVIVLAYAIMVMKFSNGLNLSYIISSLVSAGCNVI